ncbi:MAG TPA: hypothetical protein VEZ12_16235 [Herpetosiphonaceae bacterium]|nr:hypothetical protein [Herpetosiphonaceae bacterium]
MMVRSAGRSECICQAGGVIRRRLLRTGLVGLSLWLLLSCSFVDPPPDIADKEATLPPLPTASAIPTPRPPTATVTPRPTRTAVPTLTPAPTRTPAPTATPNPQLAGVGYCRTTFGPENEGRFSARLVEIEAEQLEFVDRVTFTFSDTTGLLHGSGACFEADEWRALAGPEGPEPPGAAVLAISLDDWAHDELWQQSPLTQTQVLTQTQSMEGISFATDQLASRGTTIGIGLPHAAPFRIRTEEQPVRLVVDVDRTTRLSAADDHLAQPVGRIALPEQPIFFLQNYDVWRLRDGRAEPVTTTADLETSLAVAPDGETVAICRAPAATDPANLPYAARASLWVMHVDGREERLLADVGGCADVKFAPNGRTIAFTANTAAAPPVALSIWTVPTIVGEPRPATPLADEWDRFDGRWLPDGRLVYRARHQSDLSVLFVRDEDGSEHEISALLLTGPRYHGVGGFVVGEDMLAVEVLRSSGGGADLVLLRFDGSEVAVERRAFWQRPLAFLPDGLLYLSTECSSNVVQNYTLIRRRPNGMFDELVRGTSTAGLGDTVTLGDAMLISRYAEPEPGLRGPQTTAVEDSPGSIWLIAGDGSARREVHRAPVPIHQIGIAARGSGEEQ